MKTITCPCYHASVIWWKPCRQGRRQWTFTVSRTTLSNREDIPVERDLLWFYGAVLNFSRKGWEKCFCNVLLGEVNKRLFREINCFVCFGWCLSKAFVVSFERRSYKVLSRLSSVAGVHSAEGMLEVKHQPAAVWHCCFKHLDISVDRATSRILFWAQTKRMIDWWWAALSRRQW